MSNKPDCASIAIVVWIVIARRSAPFELTKLSDISASQKLLFKIGN